MIKAILFDADGVVIPANLLFSLYLTKNHSISMETTADFFENIFIDCITGKADLKQVLPPYLKKWGWKGSADEFIACWNKSEHVIDTPLIDYIQELRARGIICCLATNQTKERFNYMLNEMGFSNYFDKLYASAHLGYKKPDLKFYEKVISDLNTAKENVILIDDTETNIAAARAFGMKGEIYTGLDNLKKLF